MNAYIAGTNQSITGKTIGDLRSELIRRINASGFRAMTAVTENGTEIHVEAYDNQDYIRTRSGRYIEVTK